MFNIIYISIFAVNIIIFKLKMEYNKHQEDIFEFIKYGHGNVVISAVAGSGKTTTIIRSLDYIKKERSVLFLAFNSSIVKTLQERINRDKTDIKTTHSLGLSILKYNYPNRELVIDNNKYDKKLLFLLVENEDLDSLSDKEYCKNVIKLCNLGRLYLSKTVNDLLLIANKYNVVICSNEIETALELIKWGANTLNDGNVIDYTDMLYLPSVLTVKTVKYDFIIIDEAQDLSACQMALFFKCFKQGTRFIAVGDEKQCINSFAGSDIEAFKKLKNQPNTFEFPLSITYRCPKNIVMYAQSIVPDIKYHENAIDGKIIFNAKKTDLLSGDMVICRNTLPLIKLYVELMDKNIMCYIKGNDVGSNLLELISNMTSVTIVDMFNELDGRISKHVQYNKDMIGDDYLFSQEYSDLNDKIECLKILAKGIEKRDDLITKISNSFLNNENNGVCLSTIHKSKGLEADNVYILNRNLTPSKYAKQEWEKQQELNIEYVSYTRSKKILGFID